LFCFNNSRRWEGKFWHDKVEDDEQPQRATEQEKKDVGTLLAFLWASATGALPGVKLGYASENSQFNQRCEEIHSKICGGPGMNQMDKNTKIQAN
jgi:hypothetical protein